MAGLVRCDWGECRTLVEAHVGRCLICGKRHGPSPNRLGPRGCAPPKPKPKPKPAKPKPPKVPNGSELQPCVGPFGRHDCDQVIEREGKLKRCERCQAILDAERQHISRQPWQKQLARLQAEGLRR
jgi:hypothetical protein